MAARQDQLLIDRLVQIAQSLHWAVTVTDRSGDMIKVTLERPKTDPDETTIP